LKLKHDELLSSFAFHFKLRPYSLVAFGPEPHTLIVVSMEGTYYKAGAYTRPLLSST
jgi:hypothetical protein